VYHDFHWVLVATKFLSPNYIHFMLRSRSRKFWKGRSWSQTFHFRLRNPGCHTWMMASISLVMVQSNFCNRDFLTDYKFSMALRSGEFPGQSITFKFASWKSSSLFQMKDAGQYLIGIFLLHQEMPFSYLEWLFSQLHTSMYLYKFIIPSIGISEATTEKLKVPQNIFLASFASSLQWVGPIAHDSWS